jgi:hypothetical protein
MGTCEDILTINATLIFIDAIIQVTLSGYGDLIASPKPPENVDIVMNGDDATILLDSVTENTLNFPIISDYYLIFINGSGDTGGLFYILAVTTILYYLT